MLPIFRGAPFFDTFPFPNAPKLIDFGVVKVCFDYLAQDLSVFYIKTAGSAAHFFGAVFFDTFSFQNAPLDLQVD